MAFAVTNPLVGEGLTDVWFDGLVIPSFQVVLQIYPFDTISVTAGDTPTFVILSRPAFHYNPYISNADKLRLIEVFHPPFTPPITLTFTNKSHNSMQTGIGSVRNYRAKYKRS